MTQTETQVAREDLVQRDPPALLGGSCVACARLSFPRERFCPYCGAGDPALVALSSRGTIYTFTVVRFAPPGYAGPVPYTVGVVELEDGIRVGATLVGDDLEIGDTVHFGLLDVDTDEGTVTSFAYAPAQPS